MKNSLSILKSITSKVFGILDLSNMYKTNLSVHIIFITVIAKPQNCTTICNCKIILRVGLLTSVIFWVPSSLSFQLELDNCLRISAVNNASAFSSTASSYKHHSSHTYTITISVRLTKSLLIWNLSKLNSLKKLTNNSENWWTKNQFFSNLYLSKS